MQEKVVAYEKWSLKRVVVKREREGEGDGGGGAGAGARGGGGGGGEGEREGELVVVSQLLHFATVNSPLTTTLLNDHFP